MALEPPKCELLDEKTNKEMLELFTSARIGWVLVGPKKWVLPYTYKEHCKELYNFKARPDDTWVLSHPRSGTTWTQELVWLLSNNLDFERAKKEFLADRFPLFEYCLFRRPQVTREVTDLNEGDKDKYILYTFLNERGYENLEERPSPRFIKSHFPFSLLPGILGSGCKIVYVARNPKDVAVSWYHMNKTSLAFDYTGDFPTFLNYFLNNLVSWSPYWDHVKEGWAHKDHPNVLFMFYEEMQHDLPRAIKKVAAFLGKSYTDEQIAEVTDYLNIKNFRNNSMVNFSEYIKAGVLNPGVFVRQGQTGGWKNMFTPELEAKANKWIEENLKGTDLTFPYFGN